MQILALVPSVQEKLNSCTDGVILRIGATASQKQARLLQLLTVEPWMGFNGSGCHQDKLYKVRYHTHNSFGHTDNQ